MTATPEQTTDTPTQAQGAAQSEGLRRQQAFNRFCHENAKRWSLIQPKVKDRYILVELLVGSPRYFITNAVLAKYLQLYYGCGIIGILPKRNDPYLHGFAISYGITEFYYEEDLGKLITPAEKATVQQYVNGSGAELRRTLLRMTCDGLRIGDLVYDTFLRNTGSVTVESVNNALLSCGYQGLGYYKLYDRIFRERQIDATVVGHNVYLRFGTLGRVSVAHKVPAYFNWSVPTRVYKYTRTEEFPGSGVAIPGAGAEIDPDIFDFMLKQDAARVVAAGREILDAKTTPEERTGSTKQGGWHSYAFDSSRKTYSREEFCQATGIDPAKPIAVLLSHAMPDGPHNYSRSLFDDYFQWLKATLDAVVGLDGVNWIVKPHPDDKHYRSNVSAEALYQSYKQHPHIALSPNDLNNRSLFDFADALVTVRGKGAFECAAHGIPVITAGAGPYSGLGFTYEPKNLAEYQSLLERVGSLPKLNQEIANRAYAYIALAYRYLGATSCYVPEMPLTPWEKYDLADVFQRGADLARDHPFGQDPFFRSLSQQLILGERYLCNHELLAR